MAIISGLHVSPSHMVRRNSAAELVDRDPLFATFGGTAGDDTIFGTKLNDVISGEGGVDLLVGRGGHDVLNGGLRNDELRGGHGDDTLNGNEGGDRIIGGLGVDVMSGGLSATIFVYGRELDSLPAEADTITDFRNNFRFDMSAVDAVRGGVSNEPFTFIGTANFTAPGQLRALQVGADTLLEANTIGARGAEMEILLLDCDASRMSASHFVL